MLAEKHGHGQGHEEEEESGLYIVNGGRENGAELEKGMEGLTELDAKENVVRKKEKERGYRTDELLFTL